MRAVLSHIMEDGSEKPIAFALRSLAAAEKKYSQLDKEGLAVVFDVKKFHQYLFGRSFNIKSDHRPLQYLFNETRGIPTLASARIQRWALTFSAYDYQINYKEGSRHANADLLSRLPLPETVKDIPVPGETVLLFETLQVSPITAAQIRLGTDRDPVLSHVRNLLLKGWRETLDPELCPYFQRRDELSIQEGVVLCGCQVVVPTIGQQKVLDLLHESHPGVVRMKAIARSAVWWPGVNKDIGEKVRTCQQCQVNQKSPPLAPMHPWEWPKRPWARIHINHRACAAGEVYILKYGPVFRSVYEIQISTPHKNYWAINIIMIYIYIIIIHIYIEYHIMMIFKITKKWCMPK